MFLTSFVSGHWQANCYIIAADDSKQAVIIDPGMEAANRISQLCTKHELTPAAVLCTHGHLDHVADAATVCAEYGIPAWIHSADRHLLADPLAGLSYGLAPFINQLYPDGFSEPANVCHFDDHFLPTREPGRVEIAGIELTLIPAPGHTPGCVLIMTESEKDNPTRSHLVFTGDVVFDGSIGNTEFPGGDMEQMRHTLINRVLTLPAGAAILSGHGRQASLASQKLQNPYLQPEFLARRF
ncbi:MAG: MBL fold metallo-hydrolase [Propionibacteriaceae bacterium]|nr:MBL fold metallo-hydrolase [Propionibacteriaceae bacterium]